MAFWHTGGVLVLRPVLRDYAWGTIDDIPRLLRMEATGGPVAEAWWGAHGSAPSDAGDLPLDECIAREPEALLGEAEYRRWGARLPFLLKVLAIDKPLSIQVHPTMTQARQGFEREQRGSGGVPHTFQDPFHKPEMVVAISPMVVLAGVRPLVDLRRDLAAVGTPGAAALEASVADASDIDEYIRAAISGAGDDVLAALPTIARTAPYGSSLAVAARALEHFPGDRGVLVALALNVVQLAPGEAVYTGAGVLHSYQSGMGLEVMANSDNVVRAGLTPKHVDVPLLLSLAGTTPAPAVTPDAHHESGVVTLTTEADEFGLTLVGEAVAPLPSGPRIVLALEGSTTVTSASDSRVLSAGDAVFVPAADGDITVSTDGAAVVAHLPYRMPAGESA